MIPQNRGAREAAERDLDPISIPGLPIPVSLAGVVLLSGLLWETSLIHLV